MKTKIKKALDLAVNNLLTNNNWLASVLKRSDVKIFACFTKEYEVATIIRNARAEAAKAHKHSWKNLSCFEIIYSDYVEPGSFVLDFECCVNGWFDDCEWYFIGDRENGIKRICRVDFVDDQALLNVYDLPLQPEAEIDEIYQFANDVLQAFIIDPHLFEVFYDFQVKFFGNDKDILYDVKYLAEYERVDV